MIRSLTLSRRAVSAALSAAVLAACSGGGGGTEPEPPRAPVITVTGVSDGATYDAAVTPSISVDRGTYSATLDGATFFSGSEISAFGAHELVVTARNGSATSTETVRFTLVAPAGAPTAVVLWPDVASVGTGESRGFMAVGLNAAGERVPGGFTWTTSSEGIATVTATGVVAGVAPGQARIVATAPGGKADTAVVTVASAPATSSQYRGNLAFGVPLDATPRNEVLLSRREYAVGYSPEHGLAAWVGWNLNASHFGSEPRCDCFQGDPLLPTGVYRVTSSDYTGSGFARGHVVMSEQRTRTAAENAATFNMTNILPQEFDLNGGPWLRFEVYTNDLARQSGKELYILAGPTYGANPRTLNGADRVDVPATNWKIVVVMDAGEGPAAVQSAADVQVIAVDMPNVSGISGQPWTAYRTSVDAIEAATGFDFLSELPDAVEAVVEAATS